MCWRIIDPYEGEVISQILSADGIVFRTFPAAGDGGTIIFKIIKRLHE